ncbi:hypothetical protein KTE71_03680 [Burkholderia multivorans]|uniref:hypothetical protein n=1 Tax=Burkholderia multivorans TaxID=87883 RepID=UPI001C227F48|nr:hypothetical protein [Burkholderia multivorans]MBU9386604.1 hypothetical protein [Burkholderia multivorans]MBU9437038.1 hypothetical protein [Burkholderia multivorans]ULR75089.1 hypothetical protein JC1_17 [Burkholderia phage JC1]
MKQAIALLAVTLVGCAASVKPVAVPDGTQGYAISCDGSADDWTSCYNAAANACGGKYRIVNTDSSSTPTGLGPLVRRSLIVSCKG